MEWEETEKAATFEMPKKVDIAEEQDSDYD